MNALMFCNADTFSLPPSRFKDGLPRPPPLFKDANGQRWATCRDQGATCRGQGRFIIERGAVHGGRVVAEPLPSREAKSRTTKDEG